METKKRRKPSNIFMKIRVATFPKCYENGG